MMKTNKKIEDFTRAGRQNLNRGEKLRAAMWALLAFGAVALLAELPFVLQGYRVARPILFVPLALAMSVALGSYLRFRFSHRKAVDHIDRFFELKEGLVTADESISGGRNDEIHELQLRHTEKALQPHNPVQLRPPFPRKILFSSFALVVAAFLLLMVDDSAAVKAERVEAELTMMLSQELSEELEQAFEEMLDRDNENEVAEMLEDPSLKRMIEEFEAGNDRKAVMRKLAEIDRQLAKMQSELDTRADENYLMELAAQLRQSRETAALGEALSKRNYKDAAKELQQMQMDEQTGEAQRKALEKMAAQVGETEKSMSSNSSGSRRNAQEMSRQIQKMSQEYKQNGQSSSQSRNAVNQSISRNSKSMQQLGARKQAQSALDRLRQKLQEGQNRMANNGNQPGNQPGTQPGSGQGQRPGGDQPGGQQAGEGVDRSRRPPGMTSPSEGRLDHLSGQLGEGDSERRIEDAASGTGVSSMGSGDKIPIEFQQQVEDFVRREDIPEEMKHGVKTYFEQIHTLENKPGVSGE